MASRPSKVCFVTIGATAPFEKLLNAVLDKTFLEALHGEQYTNVVLQYGKAQGKVIYDKFITTRRDDVQRSMGIEVTGFDFKADGLDNEMRRAKGHFEPKGEEGLVISHAGAFRYPRPARTDTKYVDFYIRLRIHPGSPSNWSTSDCGPQS